jgi:hypothetical protein
MALNEATSATTAAQNAKGVSPRARARWGLRQRVGGESECAGTSVAPVYCPSGALASSASSMRVPETPVLAQDRAGALVC